MKNKNLYYGISAMLIMGTAIMKLLHLPHAGTCFIGALLIGSFLQSVHIRHLEKKLKETTQNID